MLADSHCHLDMMPGDPAHAVESARNEGVDYFLNVSVDLATVEQIKETARRFDQVYASVGIHPNSDRTGEGDAARLAALADDPEVVAIGETGLDYYRSHGDLGWQHERFRYHIRAARDTGKPLIVHSRDAAADTQKVLRAENAAEVGGVMHCFVDDWDTAQQAMEIGFYISFSGIVTFKSATQLKEVARRVPLDRMLVETDAPYLAPVPHRGKPNQPAYVRHVAEYIAELRGVEVETIERATTENFLRLFKL